MGSQNIKTIRFQRGAILQREAYDHTLRFPETASRRKELFREKIHDIYKTRMWRNAGLKGFTKQTVQLRDTAAHVYIYSICGGVPKTWEELTAQEQSLVQEHREVQRLFEQNRKMDDVSTADVA